MPQSNGPSAQAGTAIVVDVGRTALRIAMTSPQGGMLHDTVRQYEAASQPTVSGAIGTFARDMGLAGLPRRLAVAVSGITRGDTISVTNGRYRVSRSGLTAMIQAPPLILNDFAANAWAISSAENARSIQDIVGATARPHGPGSFCVIGVGTGLGVALLSRDDHGAVNVVSTEAGHSAFPSGLKEIEPLIADLGIRSGFVGAETVLSNKGLVAIYEHVATLRRARPVTDDPKEIVRLGVGAREPVAFEAVSLFVKALWYFAGNMALTFGAWDGVVLTGSLAAALRPVLPRPDLAQRFVLTGPYQRELSATPRSLVTLRHPELEGAAAALLVEDARREPGPRALAA